MNKKADQVFGLKRFFQIKDYKYGEYKQRYDFLSNL